MIPELLTKKSARWSAHAHWVCLWCHVACVVWPESGLFSLKLLYFCLNTANIILTVQRPATNNHNCHFTGCPNENL